MLSSSIALKLGGPAFLIHFTAPRYICPVPSPRVHRLQSLSLSTVRAFHRTSRFSTSRTAQSQVRSGAELPRSCCAPDYPEAGSGLRCRRWGAVCTTWATTSGRPTARVSVQIQCTPGIPADVMVTRRERHQHSAECIWTGNSRLTGCCPATYRRR